ncbi:Hypothetical predicted protein, partial [Marmota monax]
MRISLDLLMEERVTVGATCQCALSLVFVTGAVPRFNKEPRPYEPLDLKRPKDVTVLTALHGGGVGGGQAS